MKLSGIFVTLFIFSLRAIGFRLTPRLKRGQSQLFLDPDRVLEILGPGLANAVIPITLGTFILSFKTAARREQIATEAAARREQIATVEKQIAAAEKQIAAQAAGRISMQFQSQF
jgi:hypothetical protein